MSNQHSRPKRPDGDPLEVTPHERFELATHENGGIAPYEVVISRMAKPIMNEVARRGLGAWWEVGEVIERISWAYQVPKTQVEQDLHTMGERYLLDAQRQAMADGTMMLDAD
jgi:hypothetical protein